MPSRIGDWIQTVSGKKVYPLDPRVEEICIEDIAHSLSLICRFTGHTREHYSVAQHSVLASVNVPENMAMAALLHDSAEAYMNDISRPVKRSLWVTPITGGIVPIKHIEENLERVIFSALGVPWPEDGTWKIIKEIDEMLLATEARDLMSPLHEDWTIQESKGYKVLPQAIVPWPSAVAKEAFLKAFAEGMA